MIRLQLLFLILLHFSSALFADEVTREIRSIIITGTTIDIGIDALTAGKTGILTDREIEAIGVTITDRYHALGYTTTFVKQVSIKDDRTLEFRVVESKIADIRVSGLSGKKSEKIQNIINPQPAEIYNRFTLEERTGLAKKELNLSSVSITVKNIENADDVLLLITAKESMPLSYRGGILFEPIYGTTPSLELSLPLGPAVLSAGTEIGIREGEVKKMQGSFRAYCGPGGGSWALFAGYTGLRRIEIWESAENTYSHTSHTPAAGFRFLRDLLIFEMSINYSILDIEEYPGIDGNQRDLRFDIFTAYSDSRRSINRHDSSEAAVSLSSGWSSITGDYYQSGNISLKTCFSPVVWLKLKPRLTAFSTSADERYYWSYVFDGNLPGFYDDFTASRTKIIAGTGLEYEIIPEQFYSGPFINSGRYVDENGAWKTASGAGISAMMIFGNYTFKANYAWDISHNPGDGGFFMSLDGSF